jgi:acyl carrier protein
MNETRRRLAECFSAVFPELAADEIVHANTASVQRWDSVGGITLLTAVEEEFGITFDLKDLEKFDSFERILARLQEIGKE